MSENQEPYRIGVEEYQTLEGEAFFGKCLKSAGNFLKSRGLNNEVAEELCQIIAVKILEKLRQNNQLKVDCGYFVNFAKNIYKEYSRNNSLNLQRFVDNYDDENPENTNQPIDENTLKNHQNRQKNLPLHECILECFQNLTEANQIILFRYSFIPDEHSIGENTINNKFIGAFADFLKVTFMHFFSMQNTNEPMATQEKAEVRLKVLRVRRNLRFCVRSCISRKKGII
jgi:hypothetical protein